jgi:hypothetical protein
VLISREIRRTIAPGFDRYSKALMPTMCCIISSGPMNRAKHDCACVTRLAGGALFRLCPSEELTMPNVLNLANATPFRPSGCGRNPGAHPHFVAGFADKTDVFRRPFAAPRRVIRGRRAFWQTPCHLATPLLITSFTRRELS